MSKRKDELMALTAKELIAIHNETPGLEPINRVRKKATTVDAILAQEAENAKVENQGVTDPEQNLKDGKFYRFRSEMEGACAIVWDIADNMPDATRSQVVKAAIDHGVASGTARTQYQAWFRSKRNDREAQEQTNK